MNGSWIGIGFKIGPLLPFQIDIPKSFGLMALQGSESLSYMQKLSTRYLLFWIYRLLISFSLSILKEKIPTWR